MSALHDITLGYLLQHPISEDFLEQTRQIKDKPLELISGRLLTGWRPMKGILPEVMRHLNKQKMKAILFFSSLIQLLHNRYSK